VKPAATVAVLVVLALAAQTQAQVLPAVVEQLKRDAVALVTVDKPPATDHLALGLGLVTLLATADAHFVDQGRQHLPGWIHNFKTGGAAGSANTLAASLIAGGLVGWWIGHRLSVSHELVERAHEVALSWAPLPGGAFVAAHISF
jgi:hypothetical protein